MTTVVAEEHKMTALGPLPPEWEVVRLGDVAKVSSGGSAPQGKEFFGGQNPFIRVQHLELESNTIRRWDIITDEAVNKCGLRLYPKGTIVFPKSGASIYLEKRAILPIDAYIVSHLCAVISQSSLADQNFLFYYLRFTRLSEQKAEGYPTLNLTEVKQRRIACPPLHEQKKIAYVLSGVQAAIEKTEAVVKVARELKKSLMKHLFTHGSVSLDEAENVPLKETEVGLVPEGWEVVKLGTVCQKTRQADPTRNPEVKFSYVDVSSISRDFLSIVDSTEHLGANAPSRARKVIRQNDVIFATVRSYLKRIAVVPAEFDGQICSTAFCVIRANPALADPFYLFHSVSRDRFVQRVSGHQRGSSYPAVTDKDVLNELIPLPSLSTQKQIADVLSNVDRKIETEENRKKALEALFKTLLRNLMAGKIRVNGLEVSV